MSEISKQRKIVVLGYTFVGKTAICTRLCMQRFHEGYEPTYENSHRRVMRFNGSDIDVSIVDTQGQDEQELFRNEYCLGAHGYVLVFSIASPRSLKNLQVINEKLISLMGTKKVPRVLVGNKNDLESKRRVMDTSGRALADSWDCPYVECSAKNNANIEDVFRLALREIDRFGDEDVAIKSITCSSLFNAISSLFYSAEMTRSSLTLSFVAWANLALGVLAVVAAFRIVFLAEATDEENFLAYVMFGIGFAQCIICALGITSIRNEIEKRLQIFGGSLFVLALLEVALSIWTYSQLSATIWRKKYLFAMTFFIISTQTLTAIFTFWFRWCCIRNNRNNHIPNVTDYIAVDGDFGSYNAYD